METAQVNVDGAVGIDSAASAVLVLWALWAGTFNARKSGERPTGAGLAGAHEDGKTKRAIREEEGWTRIA